MTAREHARKMLVKRNHAEDSLPATEPVVEIATPVQESVQVESSIIEPTESVEEVVKPKKAASRKKKEPVDDSMGEEGRSGEGSSD